MSASIRFTNSAKRHPKSNHSHDKQTPILLNGTPVKKVTGSALRSAPVKRPARVTTHLALSPAPSPTTTTDTITTNTTSASSASIPHHHHQHHHQHQHQHQHHPYTPVSKSCHHLDPSPSSPSSPSSPCSPVSSASLSSASSSASSASYPSSASASPPAATDHQSPPTSPPSPPPPPHQKSTSPARRPRNMIPVPEIPIPDWNHQLDPDTPFNPDSPSSSSTTTTTTVTSPTDDDPPSGSPQPPQTFFIHNGYRYDGEVFELRPPQERSIASRPERILEHKPALLPHRQQFNRVYSEGTYNARPSSLRQIQNRNSSRFSSELRLPTTFSEFESPHVDLPGCEPVPLPVTRPPSIRPPTSPTTPTPTTTAAAATDTRPLHTRNQPDNPTPAESLCESIDRARLAASITGDTKLQGLLAYSAVPVTRITGEPPAPHITKAHCVVAPRSIKEHSSSASLDENRLPPGRERRGRSYTSFAKSTPYLKPKSKEKERKPSLWKMFTR